MRILTFIVIAMLLLGCGTNLNGRFRGNTTGAGLLSTQQQQIIIDMRENGGYVTGNFQVVASSLTGVVSGTVSGTTISPLYLTANQGGSTCSWQGSGTIGNAQVTINVNPSGVCGTQAVTATLYKDIALY